LEKVIPWGLSLINGKSGAEKSSAAFMTGLKLPIGFVLDGLASVLHVFTETVGRLAPGENHLPHNRDQKAESGSF
jgi:hypothetical protein